MTNSNILSSYEVDYANSGDIFQQLIVKKIAALRDEDIGLDEDLFIGATGDITVNVNGYNALTFTTKDVSSNDYTTQIEAINTQSLEIIPGDSWRTTKIGSLEIKENVSKQYIESDKDTIVITGNVEIDGSIIIGGDYLADGAIFGTSLNTIKEFSADSNTIGYGFRIDDSSNLELYKFDSTNNVTQVVAIFGSGEVVGSNTTTSFPVYQDSSNVTSTVEYSSQASNDFFSSNGTDIYYNKGRLGIGTDTPTNDLQVVGTARATKFIDGTLTIKEGVISDAVVITTDKLITTDGSSIEALNASYITSGTIANAYLPNTLEVTSVDSDTLTSKEVTVTGDIYFSGNLYQDGDLVTSSGSVFSTNSSNIYFDTGYIGVGTGSSNPSSSLYFTTTDAIRIPTGTTAERPTTEVQGMIRYNTSTSQFEGYGGTSWSGMGGVVDVDGDTYIIPESSAGSDEDQLSFYTANTLQLIINSSGYFGVQNSNPVCTFDMTNITDAIAMPIGTTAQRPTGTNGMLRYNNEDNAFEGYINGQWSSIGGSVIDTDEDTYISVELTTDDDTIRLFAGGSQNMDITTSNINLSVETNIEGVLTVNNSVIINSNIEVTGNIIPSVDGTYNLGSSNYKWNELYLSGNSMYIGDTKIGITDSTVTFTDHTGNTSRSIISDTITIKDAVTGNNIVLEASSGSLSITDTDANTSVAVSSSVSYFSSNTNNDLYYNGHTVSESSNYTYSETYTSADSTNVMNTTDNFIDLTTLTIPDNAPLERVSDNVYVIKAIGSISLDLLGSIDGSTLLVSDDPDNTPTSTYTLTSNVSQSISFTSNDYFAITSGS